jgi:PQQ-like domain
LLSTQKLQMPHEGPMHLLALEGQIWMATSALRRMENNSGVLSLVGEPVAVGVSSQPIQQLGDSLYLARHRPFASSSLMIQFQYESMRTNWGLTMGSSILAANATGNTLVCVNEDGHVFRLSTGDFAADPNAESFQQTPSVTLNLPADLETPLGALALMDGSLFVYAGGKQPKAWFITPNAQLSRGLSIPGDLQTKPVAVHDGMVLPLEGRLHYEPIKPGGPSVDDYTRKLDVNPPGNRRPPRWMHLERLDENQFVAVDSEGALMRFQFRTDPRPHLFEVRNLQLKSPVNVPFVVFEGTVVFADADRQLHVLDAQSFQILGSTELDGVASNALWMVDGKVFVETNHSELQAFELTPEPKKLWSLSLGNSGLAGSPLTVGPDLLVTKQNGDVWMVDPHTGDVRQRHSIGQTLVNGPMIFGNHILAFSLDGSLYPLESLLTGGK